MPRRALVLLPILVLAACGGGSKPAGSLRELLPNGGSAHFVLDGTVRVRLNPLIEMIHPVPPTHVHATGDASADRLMADFTTGSPLSASGTLELAGDRITVHVLGSEFSLPAENVIALAKAGTWTSTPAGLHGTVDVSSADLETLVPGGLPAGVEGASADVDVAIER